MNGYLNVISKNNLIKAGSLVLPLFMVACSSNIPTQVEFQQQNYQLVHQQTLGGMAHFVYATHPLVGQNNEFKRPDQLLDWFVDTQKMSTEKRFNIRQNFFQKHHAKWLKLSHSPQQLTSVVIYQPSQQLPFWQADISLGKNLPSRGFVQWQYSFKGYDTNLIKLLWQSDNVLLQLKNAPLPW